ncbi:hypothetical protein B2H85_10800 [Clostridium botulinum]|nr:hypothetical protein B2H85_10800 [Clostridium botulinum]
MKAKSIQRFLYFFYNKVIVVKGNVIIAPGTMYGALDNLTKQKLIQLVKSEDAKGRLFRGMLK